MISTSDIIYLLIGLGRIALAILTIYATIMARAGNDFPVENIEMQSLSQCTNGNSPHEHEITLRAIESWKLCWDFSKKLLRR
ncbi:hypothetical protein V8E51_012936 [Hyaloscypha variabilis]